MAKAKPEKLFHFRVQTTFYLPGEINDDNQPLQEPPVRNPSFSPSISSSCFFSDSYPSSSLLFLFFVLFPFFFLTFFYSFRQPCATLYRGFLSSGRLKTALKTNSGLVSWPEITLSLYRQYHGVRAIFNNELVTRYTSSGKSLSVFL